MKYEGIWGWASENLVRFESLGRVHGDGGEHEEEGARRGEREMSAKRLSRAIR